MVICFIYISLKTKYLGEGEKNNSFQNYPLIFFFSPRSIRKETITVALKDRFMASIM